MYTRDIFVINWMLYVLSKYNDNKLIVNHLLKCPNTVSISFLKSIVLELVTIISSANKDWYRFIIYKFYKLYIYKQRKAGVK